MLDLIDDAVKAGWSFRCACRELELGEVRAYRWIERRVAGQLADRAPGGSPMHGLLDDEVAEIIALYHEWGDVDRSQRKLAYRGSYLQRVWVSPASVRRVLAVHGLSLHPAPRARPVAAPPVPGLGRVPAEPDLDLRHDTLHPGSCRRHRR